jgi:acetyl-CoA carboxylase carboxyl transferase subunit beta
MTWFQRKQEGLTPQQKKKELPDGLWTKCTQCNEIIFRKELEKNLSVCPKCKFHFSIPCEAYIEIVLDEGSFQEVSASMQSIDPLKFKDSKKYTERILDARKKTGMNEAIVIGEGTIEKRPVVFGIMEFQFFGGSVGSVVGEKIARAVDLALEKKIPLIIVSSSGGMRMQEGILSLMQMAKTAAKLAELSKQKIPYISILTNPTTGGTSASFSMLGDVIIAEPQALIGFAGPRVIKQTIGQDMPPGFQRSEFLLDHGFLDMIVGRKDMKKTLHQILSLLVGDKV